MNCPERWLASIIQMESWLNSRRYPVIRRIIKEKKVVQTFMYLPTVDFFTPQTGEMQIALRSIILTSQLENSNYQNSIYPG